MSKKRTIILLGILTAILPLTGFPGAWRSFFTFVFGVTISALAFIAYRNGERNEPLEKKENSFTENTAPKIATSDSSTTMSGVASSDAKDSGEIMGSI